MYHYCIGLAGLMSIPVEYMACETLLIQYFNHMNDCSVQFMKDIRRPETAVLQIHSYS